MIRYFGATDVGKKRMNNQDAFSVRTLSTGEILAVLCDGMGGANAGNVASDIALHTFFEYIETALTAYGALTAGKTSAAGPGAESESDNEDSGDASPKQDLAARIGQIYPSVNYPALLESAAEEANQAVYNRSLSDPEYEGMGTTLVAALIREGTLYCCNVGDSRLYLVQGDAIRQVTHDHSYVQYLVDIGRMTQEEAETSPYKNIITRSIGREKNVFCDTYTVTLRAGAVAPDEFTDTREVLPSARAANERRARSGVKSMRSAQSDDEDDAEKPIYVLLCSDGLTNYVSRDIMRGAVVGQMSITEVDPENEEPETGKAELSGFAPADPTDLRSRVSTLLRSANDGGGGDNITAILIECEQE